MSRFNENKNHQLYMPRTPNWLIRWGISILAIIFFGMLLVVSFFPYSRIISGEIVIGKRKDTLYNAYIPVSESNYVGVIKLESKEFKGLEVGQKVVVHLENYPFIEYGSLIGNVSNISKTFLTDKKRWNYVEVTLKELYTSLGKQIPFEGQLYGQAQISIGDDSLLNRLVKNNLE